MSRYRRTVDPEFSTAAEQRSYLVPDEDMAAIKLGLSTAASSLNWKRPLTEEERARVLAADQALGRVMMDMPVTLEGHLRRAKGRFG